MNRLNSNRSTAAAHRRGFTLIEMMVVILILAITGTLALAVVNVINEGDRFPSSVRTIQAALAGARDRALRTRLPRGVRFYIEDLGGDSSKKVITSMIYIGSSEPWKQGKVVIATSLGNTTLSGTNTNWTQLQNQELLTNGSVVKIKDDNQRYTVIASGGEMLTLTKTYSGPDDTLIPDATTGESNYSLELSPAVLPEVEPIRLSSGVAIVLDSNYSGLGSGASAYESPLSDIYDSVTASPKYIDIIYSPKGTLAGRLEPNGQVLPTGQIVYFYLADVQDITNGVLPGSDEAVDKRLFAIYTQSGSTQSFPVGPTSDILKFARAGNTSAQ